MTLTMKREEGTGQSNGQQISMLKQEGKEEDPG